MCAQGNAAVSHRKRNLQGQRELDTNHVFPHRFSVPVPPSAATSSTLFSNWYTEGDLDDGGEEIGSRLGIENELESLLAQFAFLLEGHYNCSFYVTTWIFGMDIWHGYESNKHFAYQFHFIV
jgi:hypothetical protein